MWEFLLIEMLTHYSWSFIEIHLHRLDDTKPDFFKFPLSIFIYSHGSQSRVGAPHLWLAWAPLHLSHALVSTASFYAEN